MREFEKFSFVDLKMGLFNNVGRYSDIHEYIRNFQQQTQSGLKLDVNNNYDIEGKRLANVGQGVDDDDAVVKSQLDEKIGKTLTDHLDANFHVIKNVGRGSDDDAFPVFHGKQIFLTTDGNNFDAKNQKIINVETDTSIGKCAVNVNALNAAVGSSSQTQDIDLQDKYNIINSKQRDWGGMTSQSDSLLSFSEVLEHFLPRTKEFPMKVQLNMDNNSITNLKNPVFGHEAATKDYADQQAFTGDMGGKKITNLKDPDMDSDAANKGFVKKKTLKNLPLAGGTMSGGINMGVREIINLATPTTDLGAANKKYVDDGRFHASGATHNPFLYLMEDVDESETIYGIVVSGIEYFADSPHHVWKTAYRFRMIKDNDDNMYKSRIGFNLFLLPKGAYTFVVEFFPPTTQTVSIDCRSASINVNKQVFRAFPGAWKGVGYWKNLAQIIKYVTTPPEYLLVDIKSEGDSSSPSSAEGWMIVYGVAGTHDNVASDVLDRPSVIENGEEIMQVQLNMNQHSIHNLPLPVGPADATSKQYVDEAGINSILNMATATYVDGYIKSYADCLYMVERGGKNEVIFSGSEQQVSTLVDHTLSLVNANQATSARQPKLSKTKNAKRFFLTFDGSDDRMVSSLDLNNDKVHVFILYRIKTFNGTNANFRNGLFGHDNGGWDKFLAFQPNETMIISGVEPGASSVYGGNNVTVDSSEWQTKADASALNKWICLSLHWDVGAGSNGSSCWVNVKKIKTFQAKSSVGSNQMTFGDLDPNGIAGFNGDIQLFLVYKGREMSDRLIRAHHKMICERFEVDHETFLF